MSRCGCTNACACVLQGDGVTTIVTGSGTGANPYVIEATGVGSGGGGGGDGGDAPTSKVRVGIYGITIASPGSTNYLDFELLDFSSPTPDMYLEGTDITLSDVSGHTQFDVHASGLYAVHLNVGLEGSNNADAEAVFQAVVFAYMDAEKYGEQHLVGHPIYPGAGSRNLVVGSKDFPESCATGVLYMEEGDYLYAAVAHYLPTTSQNVRPNFTMARIT